MYLVSIWKKSPKEHALKHQRMFGVAVPLHTAEAPKRIVRRCVFGSIWGR
ncbi:hypothetical protein Bca101_097033 [Brassica carinata]